MIILIFMIGNKLKIITKIEYILIKTIKNIKNIN